MALLLERICDHYLASRDFNGFYVAGGNEDDREEAVRLVRDGLVQVVSEEDFVNPHIRPWPPKRSAEAQLESLNKLDGKSYGVCLYPTPRALREHRPDPIYPDQPYRQGMAEGRGTLELVYFAFDVLEQYRNDPRFVFDFHDFGARTVIGDAAYGDEGEPAHDKIIMDHIGFAYELSDYAPDDSESPIVRRVCAFYGDLADLSAVHQQRWKTYEVTSEGLKPHPVWWMQQMGHFADGLGPFEKFFTELDTLNALFETAFGEPLFRTTTRPGAFGWLLRPSQKEWDDFVHELDKLLSENLRHQAFDAVGVPRQDDQGQPIGTLNRLAVFLETHGIPANGMKQVLGPLREVRAARQKPAHALRTNVSDKTFIHKQVALLSGVASCVGRLRRFVQTHPANADWEESDYLKDGARSYRL